jgi:DNA-nicking Smr family endonuclease
MKRSSGFNSPFDILKDFAVKEKTKPEKRTKREAPVSEAKRESTEEELYALAIEGVKPLKHDRVTPEPEDPQSLIHSMREHWRTDDQDVLAELDALVKGRTRFDITSTGEYVEGHVASFDPDILKRLKDGECAIQGHLDLHGLTQEEAKMVLDPFIQNAIALGNRCLLIIHGRGLKSPEGPVLKEAVIKWLTTGRLSHHVLALCSARACDGGTGALYVLLRKRAKKSRWKRPT